MSFYNRDDNNNDVDQKPTCYVNEYGYSGYKFADFPKETKSIRNEDRKLKRIQILRNQRNHIWLINYKKRLEDQREWQARQDQQQQEMVYSIRNMCTKCWEGGHSEKFCRKTSVVLQTPLRYQVDEQAKKDCQSIQCNFCNENGHMDYACPKAPANIVAIAADAATAAAAAASNCQAMVYHKKCQQEIENKELYCDHCRHRGHLQEVCPVAKGIFEAYRAPANESNKIDHYAHSYRTKRNDLTVLTS